MQGIGLPLEEAIRFWRLEFAQVRGARLGGGLALEVHFYVGAGRWSGNLGWRHHLLILSI